MKKILFIGGPLILFIGLGLWTDAITYGDQSQGMVHFGGVAVVQQDTYMCDENGNNCVLVDSTTEVSEVAEGETPAGISQSANYRLEEQSTGFGGVAGLEIEDQPIEYREGSEPSTMTKQPGLAKYANISIQRPTDFDWKGWKFIFEREAALNEVRAEFEQN